MDMTPNSVVLMTSTQLNSLIPEQFKERYWDSELNEDGTTSYTQITWANLVTQDKYKLTHGATPLKVNAIWQGNPIGDRYVVSLYVDESLSDLQSLITAGMDIILTIEEGKRFLNDYENTANYDEILAGILVEVNSNSQIDKVWKFNSKYSVIGKNYRDTLTNNHEFTIIDLGLE